jgi:alpha-glucosidase
MRPDHVPLPSDPVLYEIYVRSFFDSNGDGIGDIEGIKGKLDYLAGLGIDGIWLTPVFKSPQFDFGYDVSDYLDLHSEYGTLSDFKKLVREAHARRISVVLDVILGHTSIEHPWFRDHPERYIWSRSVPNNWLSVFGGSAWTLDRETGLFYYHRFYKEQPNLNWNNAEVRTTMHEILRFWIDMGVDGFRLDSLDGLVVDAELRDEPPCAVADLEGRENDTWAEFWSLKHVYTSDLPQVVDELSLLTTSYPRTSFFVEADLPSEQLVPYNATGASAFAFDLLRSPANGKVLARIIDGAGASGPQSWALSNHDQPRVASRWGEDLAGVAATLLLSLPGCSFIYQGDEIGMMNGSGPVIFDRSGRDSVRRPMQWTADGGFTTGTPWLPMPADSRRNVSAQVGVPGALLETYRSLIRKRRLLSGTVQVLDADDHRLVFRRGHATVHLNLGDCPVDLRGSDEVLFSTDRRPAAGMLSGRSAAILVGAGMAQH